MRLTMKERQSLADITAPRYRKVEKAAKRIILDEFCNNTGYHRKYAILLLGQAGKRQLRRIGTKMVKVIITAKTQRKFPGLNSQ